MTTRDLDSWKIKYFTDEVMMTVIQSIINSPKTATQISFECDIPISTVYRKLRVLREKKFLHVSGFLNDRERRTKLYKKRNQKLKVVSE